MSEYDNVADLLDDMAALGAYDVAMINDQFSKFGFTYDVTTDEVVYGDRRVLLMAEGAEDARQAIIDSGGVVDEKMMATTHLVFRPLKLSEAIYRLVVRYEDGRRMPSLLYRGEGKGFQKNVEAIRRALGAPSKEVN